MKVVNIHKRVILQPKAEVWKLFQTLATKADKVWPQEHWPPMRFKEGLKEGNKGGHGPIRYTVHKYVPEECIHFKFYRPKGFNGIHGLELTSLSENKTEIRHVVDMRTSGLDILKWLFVIRWLHDAVVEDALDKIETHFSGQPKSNNWSFWVRFWRYLLKPNGNQPKYTKTLTR